MIEYLEMMARADRAFHDVAQLHLHDFAPRTDGGRELSGETDRDWRETAYLTRSNWPEAIPNNGPRREYGPYPWPTLDLDSENAHDALDERDSYYPSHVDAASVGHAYRGDVCPYCGVPLKITETVYTINGTRGELGDVVEGADPTPAYHPTCWAKRRGANEHTLGEWGGA